MQNIKGKVSNRNYIIDHSNAQKATEEPEEEFALYNHIPYNKWPYTPKNERLATFF